MAVTIEFPPEVESRLKSETVDLAAEVRQSAALELFRRGKGKGAGKEQGQEKGSP